MFTRREALLPLASALYAAPASELCFRSAIELTQLIKTKKLSARELLAAHLEQIGRTNPKVNAIITLVAEQAGLAAKAADEHQAQGKPLGPLHGLPVAHKDLANTKGIRTTFGSPIFKDLVPTEDDLIVDRIRAGGAITIGKTNTPEFGAGSQTFNTLFGATLNPYDTTKTCGGSSGGAAVALATGMIPIADGSDMGGSLRNPASFCNIVGFRPSIGRVPLPNAPFAWSTMSTAGPMARSVGDLALLFSAIAGPHPGAPLSLPEPGAIFRQPLQRNFKGTRVAWFKDLGGNPFDPRVRAVIDAQRKTFEALGCTVEQAEPDFTGADFAFKTLRAWLSASTHGERILIHRALYKDTLLREVEEGLKLTGPDIAKAERLHGQLWRRFQQFLGRYEYFILPTTQVPAFDVKLPYLTEINGTKFDNYIDWMRSCWFISITGNPAISVPAGFTPEGLPVGIQIVGRHNMDFSVLQLGHAFEQATHVARRRPPVS
jgi:amidase